MRSVEERWAPLRDGTRLFYRYWPGTGTQGIVLLHRGHEHSGRLEHLPGEFDLPEHSFFAWDARAHGRSEGAQDSGTTMATFAADLDDFIRHLSAEHGIAFENLAVVAQSVGAVIAADWAHTYAPPIRCLVLASPAFKVKLYIPFARPALALAHAVAGDFFVQSYVTGSALTHDTERARTYGTDPLIRRPISVRVLLGLYHTAARVVEDAQAIRLPVQLLLSGRDWVVHNAPQLRFFQRLGSAVKEQHAFPGFFHDTLGEKDRHLPIAKARKFLLERFAEPVPPGAVTETGFTQAEFAAHLAPLPVWSPKRVAFAAQRLFLRTLGQLSDGVRLGERTGYDSGASLDFVYRNRPSGRLLLGRLIDFFYLNAIGWRGIRVRKRHLEELLRIGATRLRAAGSEVRLLDIAAGHGLYTVEASAGADWMELRDLDESNVRAAGEMLIASKQPGIARQADAFDADAIASAEPQPTIAVVSGLFELFPENARVERSLNGLARALPPGGYLVYTGQPWHPQLEMIARTLTSHRGGAPWVMRRRPQAELDALVTKAGFEKIAERVDEWGIFTVSLARRV